MASEKNINTRIQLKNDSPDNWDNKASGFIPKKGEAIIYNPTETHPQPRIKIGDGKSGVKDLPFIDDGLVQANSVATKDTLGLVKSAAEPITEEFPIIQNSNDYVWDTSCIAGDFEFIAGQEYHITKFTANGEDVMDDNPTLEIYLQNVNDPSDAFTTPWLLSTTRIVCPGTPGEVYKNYNYTNITDSEDDSILIDTAIFAYGRNDNVYGSYIFITGAETSITNYLNNEKLVNPIAVLSDGKMSIPSIDMDSINGLNEYVENSIENSKAVATNISLGLVKGVSEFKSTQGWHDPYETGSIYFNSLDVIKAGEIYYIEPIIHPDYGEIEFEGITVWLVGKHTGDSYEFNIYREPTIVPDYDSEYYIHESIYAPDWLEEPYSYQDIYFYPYNTYYPDYLVELYQEIPSLNKVSVNTDGEMSIGKISVDIVDGLQDAITSAIISIGGSDSFIYKLSSDSSYYTITGTKTKEFNEVIIPNTYNSIPVTHIADKAFENCSMNSVIISNNITYIGEDAFLNCSNLKELVIGEGVTFIGKGAFNDCTALETVRYNAIHCPTLDTSGTYCWYFKNVGMSGPGCKLIVGSKVEFLTGGLFYAYLKENGEYKTISNLQVIEFENNSVCVTIGERLCYGCFNLREINIPDSVEIIQSHAFRRTGLNISPEDTAGASGVTINISATSKLKEIWVGSFNKCQFRTIMLPIGVETILENAFADRRPFVDGGGAVITFKGTPNQPDIPNGKSTKGFDKKAFGNSCGLTLNVAWNKGTFAAEDNFWGASWEEAGGTAIDGVELMTIKRDGSEGLIYEIDEATGAEGSPINSFHYDNGAGEDYWADRTSYNLQPGVNYVCHVRETYAFNPGEEVIVEKIIFEIEGKDTQTRYTITTAPDTPFTIPLNDSAYRCYGTGESDELGIRTDGISVYINTMAIISVELCPLLTNYICTGIGTCTDEAVVIAPEYNGYPVVGIESSVFNNSTIKTLNIPDSVTTLGDNICRDSKLLKYIRLPKDLSSIPSYMAFGCSALSTVIFPGESLTSVMRDAFHGCKSILSIDLTETKLQTISSAVFARCSSLEVLSLPSTLTNVVHDIVMYCPSLVKLEIAEGGEYYSEDNSIIKRSDMSLISGNNEGTIPNGVKKLGRRAFRGRDIKSIIIPSSVTDITSESTAGIDYSSFFECDTLKNIYIQQEKGVIEGAPWGADNAYIFYEALNEAEVLDKVVLSHCDLRGPDGPEDTSSSIRVYGFKNGVDSWEAPQSNTGKDEAEVDANGNPITADLMKPEKFLGLDENGQEILVYRYKGTIMKRDSNGRCSVMNPAYKKHIANKEYVDIQDIKLETKLTSNIDKINSSIESLASNEALQAALDRLLELEDVIFGGTEDLLYEVAGDRAICKGLSDDSYASIVIATKYNGYRVTEIGQGLFENNTNLEVITLPKTLTKINPNAFNNTNNLKTVIFNGKLDDYCRIKFNAGAIPTRISKDIIIGNKVVTEIPNTITEIADYTFYNCQSVVSADLSNVTKWGTQIFNGCSNLSTVILPTDSAVTTIGSYQFQLCASLNTITIPANITTIGNSAFYGCSKLNVVTLKSITPPKLIAHPDRGTLPFNTVCVFKIPAGTKSVYESTAGWSDLKAKGFTFEEVSE